MNKKIQKYSILIADDQTDVCDVIKMCLDSEEYFDQIYEEHNGVDAEALIRKHRPDLILMDIEMPKKDGLSVIQDLLKDQIISPDRIIILSGQLHDDRIKQGAILGINNIMPKPFKQEALIQKIHNILNIQETVDDDDY